jgi:hypothetical protein
MNTIFGKVNRCNVFPVGVNGYPVGGDAYIKSPDLLEVSTKIIREGAE